MNRPAEEARVTSGQAPRKPLLGAHVSIAGGVDQAVLRGRRLCCDTIQIFVKSNVQWRMRALDPGERRRFADARRMSGISPIFAHSSYLINCASQDRGVLRKSISSLGEELRRAAELEIPFVVLHPGAHGGAGEREGIKKIAGALDGALSVCYEGAPKILLETTAGQGSGLGWRFEQLAEILSEVERPERVGVCFDTCHVFAAGYDIRTAEAYERVMGAFDRILGLERIMAFHLNDSKGPLGSRLDRHEHIGKGMLGAGAFEILLGDRRFAGVPMVLETPKGTGMAADRRNLGILRRILQSIIHHGGAEDTEIIS